MKNIFVFFKRPVALYILILAITFLSVMGFVVFFSQSQLISQEKTKQHILEEKISITEKELEKIKNEDPRITNQKNSEEIANIQKTYKAAMDTYSALLELGVTNKQYTKLSEQLAKTLGLLSQKNYASAQAQLTILNAEINKQKETVASEFKIPQNVKETTAPPASGYSRQSVNIDIGTYLVDIVAGDLGSTRVIVDTASESDCRNECAVLPLGDYVSRNGAYAGINGSYFCPASYPQCAGKTNSFDTLLMNKNKKYFNSDNNVYSTVPAVIFQGGSVRFVEQSLEWGRDTGIDSMIANQPLLVSGGKSVFGGDGEVKRSGKGSRSFVSNKGNTVYIGVVHNVSASEMAKVLEKMGMDNALNLDSGGSTALWAGGYKVGPGRAIPNAILFVKK